MPVIARHGDEIVNSEIDNRSASRGDRVRRLDILLAGLRVQRKKLSQPKGLVYAQELERFRNEARYYFLDAGGEAQKALKELEAMDFTKGVLSSERSQKARYDWIDPVRCQVFDTESERQSAGKLDRFIRLVEEVRHIEETINEVESTSRALAPHPPARELDVLAKLKSLSQTEAATTLGISPRTVRAWTKQGRLHKTANGRIACDDKFMEQYQARNSAVTK